MSFSHAAGGAELTALPKSLSLINFQAGKDGKIEGREQKKKLSK